MILEVGILLIGVGLGGWLHDLLFCQKPEEPSNSPGERPVMQMLKSLQTQIRNLEMSLKDEFANLTAKVSAEETVQQSSITLLQGLKAQLDALGSQDTIDPADVKALADRIGTDTDSLAAAVTENTPAAT